MCTSFWISREAWQAPNLTSQAVGVQVMSRGMRRLTLVHSLLSLGIIMPMLALSIDVVAGYM
jgi:uncharacterized membrane protein